MVRLQAAPSFVRGRAPARRGSAPRIVVLGGGSGLSTLLAGLKRYTDRITAVVTVTDEGGSSGRLRKGWGVLPPGDIRNCLVALAEDDALLSRLFQYRFPPALVKGAVRGRRPERLRRSGDLNHDIRISLEGHAFGNLFLAALSEVAGGFDRALAAASHVLAVRGRVLPASLEKIRLQARLVDGRRVVGEPRISRSPARIQRVSLTPAAPPPAPGVMEALAAADLVVLGPGSLYTSVIPPLLVSGVAEALARAAAPKVYICNVMTQPGETDGYSAEDHLEALLEHCRPRGGGCPVDAMLVNDKPFAPKVLAHYAGAHAFPVPPPEHDAIGPVRVMRRALGPGFAALPEGAKARHSPALLARAVMDLLKTAKREARRAR